MKREEWLNKLKAAVTMANTHEVGLRLQIVTNDAEPFKNWLSYLGGYRFATDYLAVVVDPAMPESVERGEACGLNIIELAQQLGLKTSIVKHMFDKSKANIYKRPGEKVLWIATLHE